MHIGLTLPNRLVVAPMCQYSVTDGLVGRRLSFGMAVHSRYYAIAVTPVAALLTQVTLVSVIIGSQVDVLSNADLYPRLSMSPEEFTIAGLVTSAVSGSVPLPSAGAGPAARPSGRSPSSSRRAASGPRPRPMIGRREPCWPS